MKRSYAVVTLCLLLFGGLGSAQDVPADAKRELAQEWMGPGTLMNCLSAFRLYVTHAATEGGKSESPDQADGDALAQLVAGSPGDADLYTEGQKNPEFLKWLAEANRLKTPKEREDDLFGKAEAIVDLVYLGATGKKDLGAVQRNSNLPTYALFLLLDGCRKAEQPDVRQPLPPRLPGDLEILRACYQMNSKQLLDLVTNKISPKNK